MGTYWDGESYRTSDGNSFSSQGEAEQHESNTGKSRGGGAIDAGMPFILMLFLIGPVILAKILSLIFGLFFSLGTPGRAIQTVIAGLAVGWIPALILGRTILTGYTPFWGIAGIVVCCALTALWYYYFLYPVWLYAYEDGVFSSLLTKTFSFVWVGAIAMSIFQLAHKVSNEKAMIILGLSMVAALIYYLIKTRPYSREAKQNKMSSSLVAMVISVGIVCALSGWVAGYNLISPAISHIKQGNPAIARGGWRSILYTDADDKSPVVKQLKRGDKLTLTGNKKPYRKGLYYLEAEIEGLKGWFNSSVTVITGTANVITDNATFTYQNQDTDENGNILQQGSVPVSKGETIDVAYIERGAVYGFYKEREGWIYADKVQVKMND